MDSLTLKHIIRFKIKIIEKPHETGDSIKTGKLGPGTLAGPLKNRKTWTQDSSGTLEKPENQDPGP